jgi:diaminopimelate decarboxylase
MHTGSDILDIEVFYMLPKYYLMLLRNFKDLEFLDFGSGFKVLIKKDDIETDIEELGKTI